MAEVTPKATRSGWGVGMVVLWSGFALFSVGLAIVASCQDFNLVEPDYYQKGLAHQARIDAVERSITLAVSDAEIERRREQWKAPPPYAERGLLAKYARLVGSASEGAVTDKPV